MKKILDRLSQNDTLSRDEAKELLIRISREEFHQTQVAAFLMVYRMRPIEVPELMGFRDALLDLCISLDTGGAETIDVCGTGGDGKNTFNISTLSSFIIAGAGYKVVKHGNYAVSSSCGSSNVLESFGYQFSNDSDILRRQLDQSNICYLHAPMFHPAMKGVAPVRRGLGIKTFFNMLGPLVNPARPTHQLTGVFTKELMRLHQSVLNESSREYTVIHSSDGYDEISLTSSFHLYSRHGTYFMNAHDLGMPEYTQQDLHGGNDVDEATRIFASILDGQGTEAQNDVASINAAFGIRCFEPQKSISDCIDIARESLMSGQARQKLDKLIMIK